MTYHDQEGCYILRCIMMGRGVTFYNISCTGGVLHFKTYHDKGGVLHFTMYHDVEGCYILRRIMWSL